MTPELIPFNGYQARMTYRSQIGVFMQHSTDPSSFEVFPHLEPGKIYFDHVYGREIERILAKERKYDGLYGQSYAKKRSEIAWAMVGLFRSNRERIILSTEKIPALPEEFLRMFPQAIPYCDQPLTHHYVDMSVIRELDEQVIHGGHDLVYPWLRESRCIITDAGIDQRDQPYSLLHEQIERFLMTVYADMFPAGTLYDVNHGITVGFEELARRKNGAVKGLD